MKRYITLTYIMNRLLKRLGKGLAKLSYITVTRGMIDCLCIQNFTF